MAYSYSTDELNVFWLDTTDGHKVVSTGKRTPDKECNWMEDEKTLFAEILADPDEFALKLERMALNKTANSELFEEVSQILRERMRQKEFGFEMEVSPLVIHQLTVWYPCIKSAKCFIATASHRRETTGQ